MWARVWAGAVRERGTEVAGGGGGRGRGRWIGLNWGMEGSVVVASALY